MTQLLWGSAHQQGSSIAVDVQQVNFFHLFVYFETLTGPLQDHS